MSNELRANYNASATLYAVVRRRSDGYVWNGSAFEAWADGSIATYDVPLSSAGGDLYLADFPAAITTAAYYLVDYYLQAGATPATTDYRLEGEQVYWTGGSISYGSTGTNLTSLSRVKEHMNLSVSTYDSKLNTLLASASRAIEKYCDRKFISESFVEYVNGKDVWRNDYINLRNCPVTAISRVAVRPETILEIKNTTASNQRATVQVTSTGLSLSRVASGTTTTSTLAFSSYTTVTALANAVIALGSGWTATVNGDSNNYGGWPTSLIKTIQGALNAKDGARILMYVQELYDYRLDETEGTLWGTFPTGYQSIEVRYTAGYDTIPDDVQQGCCAIVGTLFDLSNSDGTKLSERIGDYSYTNVTPAEGYAAIVGSDAKFLLDSYRKVRVTF